MNAKNIATASATS